MCNSIIFDELFWEIIHQTRKENNQDILKQKELLEKIITKLDLQQITLFHFRFAQLRLQAYRWNIYLAFEIITERNDEDDFYNFREWLIMQGKDNYYSILRDPDLLVTSDKKDILLGINLIETIGFLPEKILTPNQRKRFIQYLSEIPGDDWAGERNERITLPNLWKKYN